jgi:uroporphyrinogen decarboxylase
MHFESVDRIPHWVPWWWQETLERWAKEGHPDVSEKTEEKRFDCDPKVHIRMWLNFEPPFEEKIIEEEGEYIVIQTRKGIIKKSRKDKFESSPIQMHLHYPIESREDYLKYRSRLTGNLEARLAKINNLKNHDERDYVLSLRGTLDCGFYGPLYEMVGFDRLNILFYEDPAFVEMMMDDRADLTLQMMERILDVTTIDWFCFWEDMAYTKGPMLSPEMFRKFMMPRYKRITDFLHSKGVDIIFVDSDGDISLLIPLWLECGVNGMWPLEVQSGMDVVKLRKEYGKDLLMIGGLDKREMAKGKKEIEAEILKKVPPIVKDGGFIPRPDHSIPQDVSYENYQYFMEFLLKILEKG